MRPRHRRRLRMHRREREPAARLQPRGDTRSTTVASNGDVLGEHADRVDEIEPARLEVVREAGRLRSGVTDSGGDAIGVERMRAPRPASAATRRCRPARGRRRARRNSGRCRSRDRARRSAARTARRRAASQSANTPARLARRQTRRRARGTGARTPRRRATRPAAPMTRASTAMPSCEQLLGGDEADVACTWPRESRKRSSTVLHRRR